ncbi:MAG TPA: IS200/IS605 family transposase [Thermoguttaceae bacterium]|nr:IS200/IS605 family transposase [Thermoguttaceae bacterium]
MAHAFHELYYHFTWSTHSRTATIRRDDRSMLLKIVNEEAKKLGAWPIRHNAMPDHVHLLVRLPPTITVSDFIGRVKGAVSHRVNQEVRPGVKMKWQEGYGALTLRREEIEKVARYIDNQESHHAHGRLSKLLERMEPDEAENGVPSLPPEGGEIEKRQ